MVPCAPRNGGGAEVAETKLAGQAVAFEAIGDREFVVVGVGVVIGFGGFKDGAKSLFVDVVEAKFTLAGKSVHRHGAANAFGVAPEMDVALVEGAGGKGKQDGIAAADAGDGSVEILEFGPMNDVADGSITTEVMPVHESSAGFGPREKGGSADLPATDGMA